jgi:two-component system sensor histidine kinase HupT/HoxJ
MAETRSKSEPDPTAAEAMGDQAWISVIQKMDEVYSDLLRYEVALEEKNAALEESQNFILSVLTSISDILIVCNRAGTIEDVNESLVRFTGRPDEQLRGSSVFELFADAASKETAERLLPGQAGTLHDCELNLKTADGGSMAVSLNCTARYSSVGKMVGTVITGRPVGELRRAYKALREAHEELKRTQQQLLHSEKMASLGRLVAGVAHELNNPISFILGNVHALKRYADRLQRYLEAVHGGLPAAECEELRRELRIDRLIADLEPLIEGTVEGAERSRDIVDNLKRFSALDRNENERFDLAEVIERAVHWVQKAGRVQFRVDLDLPDTVMVLGSAGQMQQVVMNLVQNAQDATAGRTDPLLSVRAVIEDGRIVVRFHDNGPGIETEDLGRIFDPFFTTKPVGKGTGLGLSISYGIVERHGGQLAAANHPDGGAEFTLTLPLAAAPGAESA